MPIKYIYVQVNIDKWNNYAITGNVTKAQYYPANALTTVIEKLFKKGFVMRQKWHKIEEKFIRV